MCGACGGKGLQDWYTLGIPDTPAGRLASARRLAEAVAGLLGPTVRVGLTPDGRKVTVRTASGATWLVDGVPALLRALADLHLGRSWPEAGAEPPEGPESWESFALRFALAVRGSTEATEPATVETPNGPVTVRAEKGRIEAGLATTTRKAEL